MVQALPEVRVFHCSPCLQPVASPMAPGVAFASELAALQHQRGLFHSKPPAACCTAVGGGVPGQGRAKIKLALRGSCETCCSVWEGGAAFTRHFDSKLPAEQTCPISCHMSAELLRTSGDL